LNVSGKRATISRAIGFIVVEDRARHRFTLLMADTILGIILTSKRAVIALGLFKEVHAIVCAAKIKVEVIYATVGWASALVILITRKFCIIEARVGVDIPITSSTLAKILFIEITADLGIANKGCAIFGEP